jgi:hypothetical protein
MTIINVQIFKEKCHDIKFSRAITFYLPLCDGDVKFFSPHSLGTK